jgi:ankyrin repeat protein
MIFLVQEAIVEGLLEKGATENAKSKFGTPALHHASMRGNDVIVKIILKNGSEVDEKDPYEQATLKILLKRAGSC